jgi:uncharacterized protein
VRAFFLSCFLLLLTSSGAVAALQFPPLTGHVVDDAHILSPHTTQVLEQTLSDYEAGTTNQVVVATLPSLQGTSIEDYGYQLGRNWGIGQKSKNNGVLLIIAPKEHKVRIEVGYGLEGTLTDAASSLIIHNTILPAFRAGNFEQGTVEGVQSILTVLGGKSVPSYAPQSANPQMQNLPPLMVTQKLEIAAVLFALFIFFIWLSIRHPLLAQFLMNIAFMSSFSRSGGSGGGSGWSGGGGGSFGGGGASGSW